MSDLLARDVRVEAAGDVLVDQAGFTLAQGEFVALIGPNGAGKTSLIRACLGLTAVARGCVQIDGVETRRLSPVQRARLIAYLPQSRPLAWPVRVRDVIALGRFAHGAAPGRLSARDHERVGQVIADCDLARLADRRTDTLSGGELARVHCARAFAAGAPLLIADEPIAALDLRHQFMILDLIADYVRSGGGALVVLHDLSLAARYASRLIWMNGGRILADGPPGETLTAQRLETVFGVRARISGGRVEFDGAL